MRAPTASTTALLAVAGTAAGHAFDVSYLLRAGALVLRHNNRRRDLTLPRLLRWHVSRDAVSTRDLDFMGHMNNARYSRKGDMARFRFVLATGLYASMKALGGEFVLGAITQRFRRELAWREAFNVYVRVVGWDDRAFYVEHVFVKKKRDTPSARAVLAAHAAGDGAAITASSSEANVGNDSVASVEAITRGIAAVGTALASATDLEVASVLIGQLVIIPGKPGGKAPTPAAIAAHAGCPIPPVCPPPGDIAQWSASVRDASIRVVPPRAPAKVRSRL